MQTKKFSELPLPSAAPGNQRKLKVLQYGVPESRPKAYLQAALHADEIPGLLVQQQLIQRLDKAEADGEILGSVTLVPYANPIGYDQVLNGQLLGRFDFSNGVNFNRGFANLTESLAERIGGKLGADAKANVKLIREAAVSLLDRPFVAETETAALKRLLLQQAVDADYILDLHCDNEAVLHMYTSVACWPELKELSTWIGSEVSLLSEASGTYPFGEASVDFWVQLAARFPDYPIPQAGLSATIEYRGERDVKSALASEDADNLYCFLQSRGIVAGDLGASPEARCEATPLDGVEQIRAPRAGILDYIAEPGQQLKPGDIVAILIDPAGEMPSVELQSSINGCLFARISHRLVKPGTVIGKIAGSEALPAAPGLSLLSD